ncbi:MAG: hypothetical protein GWP04_02635 [Gammaproteobacteria bacterium]|nr:hypothetical protein [Gammaproteobacteria bacterium]
MSDAIIVDRGYRSYDGPRLGCRGAIAAIVRESVRRALGLRRKARRKILPWSLIAMAIISVAALIGLHWAAQRAGIGRLVASQLPGYGEYFDVISMIALLFIAFVTPQLLAPDRREGMLAVYFSRPLRPVDYLGAKFAGLGILVMGFYLVPEFVFHISLATLAPEGFFPYLGGNLDVLWQVTFVAFVYFIGYASVAFAVSVFVPRTGLAAGVFLGIMIILNQIVSAVVTLGTFPGSRYVALLALEEHPRIVRDWVFGITTGEYTARVAGFDPWVSLAVVGVLFVMIAVAVLGRYRRLT